MTTVSAAFRLRLGAEFGAANDASPAVDLLGDVGLSAFLRHLLQIIGVRFRSEQC